MRKIVDHEFPDCETSAHFKFKLDSDVSDEMINQICVGKINFLSGMDLISTFEDTSVDHYSIIKGLLTRVYNFSSSYMTSNDNASVLKILNISSSIFENRQMVPLNQDCKLDMLIWDTGE